jgi:hypothetical protein
MDVVRGRIQLPLCAEVVCSYFQRIENTKTSSVEVLWKVTFQKRL